MVSCCGKLSRRKKRSKRNGKLMGNSRPGARPASTLGLPHGDDAADPSDQPLPQIPLSQRSSDQEGEFFDCESNFTDGEMERTLSQPNMTCKQSSMRRRTPANGACSLEPESDQRTKEPEPNYLTSLWDLLWKQVSAHRSDGSQSESSEDDVLVDHGTSHSAEHHRWQQMPGALSSCLSMMHSKASRTSESGQMSFPNKPIAGASLERLSPVSSKAEAEERWDQADPTSFFVRSTNYRKTKQKVPCEGSFYETISADLFSFDQKCSHIGKKVVLPSDPYERSENEQAALRKWGIPTMLIMNMQVPAYEPSLFGNTDGLGHSLVYYCVLKKGFNPDEFHNHGAVQLLHGLIHNGREHNSDASRERLKIIPKVVNVEEWAAQAPLSRAEKKLLTSYNEKPILSRPQHAFFHGPNYFEIDFDLHSYAFLARKAFHSLFSRLGGTIFETAVVMQGNTAEELPEYLLACIRVYRVDLMRMRDFSDMALEATEGTIPRVELMKDVVDFKSMEDVE